MKIRASFVIELSLQKLISSLWEHRNYIETIKRRRKLMRIANFKKIAFLSLCSVAFLANCGGGKDEKKEMTLGDVAPKLTKTVCAKMVECTPKDRQKPDDLANCEKMLGNMPEKEKKQKIVASQNEIDSCLETIKNISCDDLMKSDPSKMGTCKVLEPAKEDKKEK